METAENKKISFVFYPSFKKTLNHFDDKDRLIMYDAITDYGLEGIEPNFDNKYLLASWEAIKLAIDSAKEKYAKKQKNGSLGGKVKAENILKKAPLSETVVNQPEYKQDKTAPQPTIIEKTEPIINQLPIVPVIEEELDEEALNNNQQLRLNDEAAFSLKYETYESNVAKQKFQNGFEFIKNKINCDDKTAIQIYELHEKTTRSIGQLIEEYNLNLAKTI
jgi:hypothetical protein